LELTLNSELPNYRWKPVTSTGVVPSLVGGDDFLWELPVQTMVNATAKTSSANCGHKLPERE
jgi:hypothetical protein